MALVLNEIIRIFEEHIPLAYQESWDKSGLQVGSRKLKVRKVLFALDANQEVMAEARRIGAQLIITHHPLTLGEIKINDLDSYDGQVLRESIKRDVAIYTAHTNHDSSPYSLNRHYAEKLGLTDLKPIRNIQNQFYCKLVVYVPVAHTEKVMDALFQAGGGRNGSYSYCSFRIEGAGTFRPDESAQPYIGSKGELTQTKEHRLEMLVSRRRLKQVLKTLFEVHPYDEVAYDIFALENNPLAMGSGIFGDLKKPQTLSSLIPIVKKMFGVKRIRLSGEKNASIRTIGLCTGSGASLLNDVIKHDVDLFITGDVKYHAAVDAKRAGVNLMDVGHFASEIRSVTLLKDLFAKWFGKSLELVEYQDLRDPLEDV